jgi:hypothetical protein
MIRRVALAGLGIEALFLVSVLGPFSLLAHGQTLTDLGQLTDHQPVAFAAIVGGLLALFAGYGLALAGVRQGKATPSQRLLALVLVGTAIFSLTLIFLYPISAIDVYNYAVEGHVAAFYQVNPLVTAPAQLASDPFVAFAGSLGNTASPYGPIWLPLATLAARLAGANVVLAVIVLKSLSALAVVGTTALIGFAPRGRAAPYAPFAALLFGWNPLVQLELVGNGHNDAILTLFLVAALVLAGSQRSVLGTIAGGLSALVKGLTLAALPILLLTPLVDRTSPVRIRLLRFGMSLIALVIVAVLAYAPYWVGPETLSRSLAVDNDYLASIPALIVLYVPTAITWLIVPRTLILLAVGLWQVNALRTGRADVVQATFEMLFATIVVAVHFAGWYLPLLVAVAALARNRWLALRMVAFSFTAALTTPLWAYVWWWNQNTLSLATFHLFVVPFTFLPALIIAYLGFRASRRPACPQPAYPVPRSRSAARPDRPTRGSLPVGIDWL